MLAILGLSHLVGYKTIARVRRMRQRPLWTYRLATYGVSVLDRAYRRIYSTYKGLRHWIYGYSDLPMSEPHTYTAAAGKLYAWAYRDSVLPDW